MHVECELKKKKQHATATCKARNETYIVHNSRIL